MNVSVEDALKEFGIYPIREPEKFRVKCPFHDDTNPSGTVHHKTGFYQCWSCGKKASLALFLTKYSNLPIYQVKVKLGVRSDCKNPIAFSEVEQDHNRIWEHPTFLHALRHRCITDELIRKHRLGVKDWGTEKRISIPILNEIGEYANLRLYIPGASSHKFLNLHGKDRSRVRLYPIEQLEYDQILICGGELKAVAAAAVLNPFGIGAIAPTCGENTWPNELNDRFRDKLLYINCDVDDTGRKYAELRCRILNSVSRELHKVEFTTQDIGGLEKGDINDFLRLGGDLYQKLLSSPEWVLIPGGELLDEPPLQLSFREAFSHENVGKKVKFTGIVSGAGGNDFLVPSEVEVKCSRDQEGLCIVCDVNSKALSNETSMHIEKEHPAILALIGEKTEDHHKIYKECFKIPKRCPVCTFHPKRSYSITEIRLDEEVEPTARSEPMLMKVGFTVNGPANLLDNQTYQLTGRLYPSPKNQTATLLISDCEPTHNALDNYNPADSEYLHIFQPTEWTVASVAKKLDEIYSDLESNVTRVWQRRDYHLAIDLAYHSILHFNLGDIKDLNGWVELLVIGDTAQGKSEALKNLKQHYGLGTKVDSKQVTKPGLTIGLEKGFIKHFPVLGILPRNDRGLVIFEELKGMHPLVFQSLTEVRSCGFVQITKIQAKTRRARCRLICISNPMDIRKIESYTYGIESAIGVIGTNEDLRRFDLVMIMGRFEIQSLPELENPPVVKHQFTDELCQKLILKAWKCEKVEFEDVHYILEVTKRLVAIFGDGPPVLDPNSSHIKIAKLSAALAARTCSYDGDKLVVRKCHTEYIEQYLTRVYSSPASRLNEKSARVREATVLRDRDGLISYLKSISNCADVMLKLGEEDTLTSSFIKDLCGDFYIGATLFSKLVQCNAIQRIKADRYAKTAEFTKLLQTVEFEIKKPDYLKKEKF